MSSTPTPQLIASRYRVLRELGRGGMGVVYVVEHVNTGDHLALKLLLAHGADVAADPAGPLPNRCRLVATAAAGAWARAEAGRLHGVAIPIGTGMTGEYGRCRS